MTNGKIYMKTVEHYVCGLNDLENLIEYAESYLNEHKDVLYVCIKDKYGNEVYRFEKKNFYSKDTFLRKLR